MARAGTTALMLAAAIVAGGASVGAVAAPRSDSVVTALPALDARIAVAVNSARAARGLTRLRLSQPLRAAARSHSYDMARRGYFSHDSYDGSSAFARVARFYPSTGYTRWQVGETLLWQAGGVDAATAVRAWLASPEHRAILLAAGFREIGVSAVHTTASSNALARGDATIVTADFGVRTP